MTIRRFELVGEGSQKFWEVNVHTGGVQYGRIGSSARRGRSYSPHQVQKKIREKLNKGYVEVTGARPVEYQASDLVRFRTDEPGHIKRWLQHSDDVNQSVEGTINMGTVVGIAERNVLAPHWSIYNVLAGGAVRRCAAVYMQLVEDENDS